VPSIVGAAREERAATPCRRARPVGTATREICRRRADPSGCNGDRQYTPCTLSSGGTDRPADSTYWAAALRR